MIRRVEARRDRLVREQQVVVVDDSAVSSSLTVAEQMALVAYRDAFQIVRKSTYSMFCM